MKTSVIGGLVASFALATMAAACGDTSDAEPPKEAPPAQTPQSETGKDAGAEAAVETKSCSAPLVDPKCGTTKAAPKGSAAVTKFVKEGAVPIRCEAGEGKDLWDVSPLVDLYGDQKIFMIGEVHGTNEIGIVSSVVFEQLASKKLVNVLGYELPMDFGEPIQNYVDTGSDPMAEQALDQLAPNFFGSILTKKARELAAKGIKITVNAVDIPMRPQMAMAAIKEVANKLTTQKNTVLATLPATVGQPPSATEVTQVNSYFDNIMAKKTAICAELSEAECERLVAMTHAFWASAMSSEKTSNQELWFARREEVIYYNMKSKMAAPSDRMFLHMGAAHTNKHTFSAGSRMSKEYGNTKGKVFSVAPAWGDGSVIFYGQDMDLPGEPKSLVTALTSTPEHPLFLSTTRPSKACEANPVGEEPETSLGSGTRAELYDGYIHYGKLTSERNPEETQLSPEDEVAAGKSLRSFLTQIERKEKSAIASGVLTRMHQLRQ